MTVDTTSTTSGPIRKFTDSKIQESVEKALEILPPGATGAVVAYATQDSAKLAVVARPGLHWTVVGVLEKPYRGKLEAEAVVRFSW